MFKEHNHETKSDRSGIKVLMHLYYFYKLNVYYSGSVAQPARAVCATFTCSVFVFAADDIIGGNVLPLRWS